MAEVQDFEENVGELEAVEAQIEQQSQEPPKSELPDKYRGKSVEDVVKMHQEAEKLIDRQSREVGEVRKLADELIKSQLAPKQQVAPPKEIDFFENPQEAINRAVQANPDVLAAKQMAIQARQEMSKQKLAQMHPDVPQLINDPEFIQWVGASKVRTQLLRAADAYDIDAADELFSTFKQLKQVRVKNDDVVEKKARQESIKAASVDTGGTGESGQKVYSRRQVMNWRLYDPKKFAELSEDIDRAYQEGRMRP